MSTTASLRGEILIKISSIKEAVEAVNTLGDELKKVEGTTKGITANEKALKQQAKAAQDTAKAVKTMVDEKQKQEILEQKISNLVARAANQVANYQQQIRKTVSDEAKRNSLLQQSSAELVNYERTLKTTQASTLGMQTANTQLTVSLGAITREMKELDKAKKGANSSAATNVRAVGQMQITYERLVSQVQASALAQEDKAKILQRLEQQFNTSSQAVRQHTRSSEEGAKAQVAFRAEAARVTEAVRQSNREFRGQEIRSFNAQMRDLSSSVQVALGPLSGVASRLTAMNALFRRNAFSVAVLFSAMAGFTVGLGKVLSAGREAERQILSLNSQIESLGLGAYTSGQQMNQMAHEIAAATLTSAGAVREATVALLEFHKIGLAAYEDVLVAAQGLSQTFGGSLAQNTIRIGRLLNDPINNFDALTRQGIRFSDEERKRLRLLQETGRLTEAQGMIMQRFTNLMERARNETGGLAGALDTLSGNFDLLTERLFTSAGVADSATDAINRLAASVRRFAESDEAEKLAKVMAMTMKALGGAVNFALENIQAFAAAVGLLMTGALIKGVVAGTKLIASLTGLTGVMRGLNASTVTASATVTGLTRAFNLGATGARALGLAARFAFPVLNVLLTSVAAFAIYQGLKDRTTDIENLGKESDRVNSKITDLNKAIKELGIGDTLSQELGEITAAQDRYSQASDNLTRAIEERAQAELSANRLTASIRRTGGKRQQKLRAKREEQRAIVAALTSDIERYNTEAYHQTQIAEAATESTRRAVEAHQQEQNELDNLTGEVKKHRDEIMSRIDAETQEIEKAKERLNVYDQTIATAEALGQTHTDEIQDLIQLRDRWADYIEELRKSTQEHRRIQASTNLLERMNRELETTRLTTIAYQNALNDTSSNAEQNLEEALSTIQRQAAITALIAEVENLNAADQQRLAVTLGLIQQGEELTVTTEQIAAAMRKQTDEQIASEKAARELFNARQQLRQLEQDNLPTLSRINQEYSDSLDWINKLTGAERQRALNAAEDKRLHEENELFQQLDDNVRMQPMSEAERLAQEFEQRRMILETALGYESELYGEYLEKLQAEFDQLDLTRKIGQNLDFANDLVSGAMDAMQTMGKENSKFFQKLAIGQALIQGAQAILGVYSDPNLGTFQKIAMAGVIGAKVGGQIGAIKAQSFSTGGFVSGQGTSTSDSIPAWLSNGEFVLNAAAVRRLGMSNVEALNEGKMPRFNQGGGVGLLTPVKGSDGGSRGVTLQIFNQGEPLDVERTEMVEGEDGELVMKAYLRKMQQQDMDDGRFDATLSTNFGLSRKPKRR